MKSRHWSQAVAMLLLFAAVIKAAAAWGGQPPPRQLPPKDKFHLYLLIGQSNMAGRGEMTDADRRPPQRVLKLDSQGRWVAAADPLHFDKPAIAGVGPGSGFGPAMAEADPTVTVGLIPAAVGGTPLSRWQKGGDLYAQAVARAQAAMADGTLRGIIWHQGEADATDKNNAATYAARLDEMIAALRAELDAADVPFVAATLGEFLARDKFPFADRVNAALEALPERVTRSACVPSAGLNAKSDQVHFDAGGARQLGRRYAEAMLRFHQADRPK